jgi:DNA-binding MarR family transcriptional regulator
MQRVMASKQLTDGEYSELLALRDGLRRFLRWSQQRAEASGLTPAQHQLLLAVRGHGDQRGPTIGDVAGHLLLRHHSVVELVGRAESAGLLRRRPDPQDQRSVRLGLTPLGRRRLARLSSQHLEELRRLASRLPALWDGLEAS